MTLLIPPVHAAVLAAVSIRHQGNTLNTHLNLLDDLSTQLPFRHGVETGFLKGAAVATRDRKAKLAG
jgi:hypothetical protein